MRIQKKVVAAIIISLMCSSAPACAENLTAEPATDLTTAPVTVSVSEPTDEPTTEPSLVEEPSLADSFTYEPISAEIYARINGISFKENGSIPIEDLRYLKLLYVDFEGNTQEGEMIVNFSIAEDILDIFEKLYEAKYPIELMTLVDDFDAVDEISMTANNTSAFNDRPIEGTTHVSKHSLGMAIDVNPLYNPYVKDTEEGRIVLPAAGEEYVTRTEDMDYKITQDDLCYQLFIEHGFEWGGNWNSLKDYQHFEVPTDKVREMYNY